MTPKIERHSLSHSAVKRFRPRLGTAHVFAVPSDMAWNDVAKLTQAIVKRCARHGDCWHVATAILPAGVRVIAYDPDTAVGAGTTRIVQ